MRSIKVGQSGLGIGVVAAAVLLSGCNSFDAKPDENVSGSHLVIPVDERVAVKSDLAPPAISGGTLTITADSMNAIVSDPARDRVSVVDLSALSAKYTINLQPGDEPGRSVEDGSKLIHVALRRGGAVVTIDPATGTITDRRAVCKAPRGLAYDPLTQLLHVACAEGKLVSLSAVNGAVSRTLTLDADLRDVLVRGSELWVTRFKSAEVLRVNSAGVVGSRVSVPPGQSQLQVPAPTTNNNNDFSGPTTKTVSVQPEVAWRAVPNAFGGAMVVHQLAVSDNIDIVPPSSQGSTYGGGGFGCSGIVQNEVTTIDANGNAVSTPFSGAPLPVDLAMSPDNQWIAVANAGMADPQAPRPFEVFVGPGGDSASSAPNVAIGGPGGPNTSVTVMSTAGLAGAGCAGFEGGGMFTDSPVPVTAVAFAPNGRLLAQTMDPPQLLVLEAIQGQLPSGTPSTIALGGDTRLDTGHELFHRDAGGGIACASCHPEGGEDGHTWHFTDTGARRTQALHVGLADTAPFHWNGDLPNVAAVMSEVFVGRMGGAKQTSGRVGALQDWLFGLKEPPAIRDASDPAAQRGQALFNSTDVGCSSCHSGAKFTNNQSLAIDTAAKKIQVPSLIAVGYRAPFMHTGCANTLQARFDVSCGGNAHGNTAGLSQDQISDLIAFLETL